MDTKRNKNEITFLWGDKDREFKGEERKKGLKENRNNKIGLQGLKKKKIF